MNGKYKSQTTAKVKSNTGKYSKEEMEKIYNQNKNYYTMKDYIEEKKHELMCKGGVYEY